MDASFYIGAYFYALNEQVTKTRRVHTCNNASCKMFGKEMSKEKIFCSSCGDKTTQDLEIEEKHAKVSSADIDALIPKKSREDLYLASGMLCNLFPHDHWIPNKKGNFGQSVDKFQKPKMGDNITMLDMVNQTTNFASRFADLIAVMQKLYGNGEVRWGVVYNYS